MTRRSSFQDTIRLTGLTATGHHGVFDAEKQTGQRFEVDAELTLDLRAAGRSDELNDTVSYAGIAELIEAAITGEPFDLIEALADHLARRILGSDERLLTAEVTVHKPQAPLTQSFRDVSVTVRRSRADLDPLEPWPADQAPETEVRAVLALGSNLGDSAATLASAAEALAADPAVRVVSASPLARTSPVGGPADQPEFLNQVIEVATMLSPEALLRLAQQVEAEHHRVRGAENGEVRWGPRTLDIDIITYAAARVVTASLQIPHPQAAQRGFVLVPWRWMDPEAVLEGVPVARLAERAGDASAVQTLDQRESTP